MSSLSRKLIGTVAAVVLCTLCIYSAVHYGYWHIENVREIAGMRDRLTDLMVAQKDVFLTNAIFEVDPIV